MVAPPQKEERSSVAAVRVFRRIGSTAYRGSGTSGEGCPEETSCLTPPLHSIASALAAEMADQPGIPLNPRASAGPGRD